MDRRICSETLTFVYKFRLSLTPRVVNHTISETFKISTFHNTQLNTRSFKYITSSLGFLETYIGIYLYPRNFTLNFNLLREVGCVNGNIYPTNFSTNSILFRLSYMGLDYIEHRSFFSLTLCTALSCLFSGVLLCHSSDGRSSVPLSGLLFSLDSLKLEPKG